MTLLGSRLVLTFLLPLPFFGALSREGRQKGEAELNPYSATIHLTNTKTSSLSLGVEEVYILGPVYRQDEKRTLVVDQIIFSIQVSKSRCAHVWKASQLSRNIPTWTISYVISRSATKILKAMDRNGGAQHSYLLRRRLLTATRRREHVLWDFGWRENQYQITCLVL